MTKEKLSKLGKEIMDMEKDYDMNIGPLEGRSKRQSKLKIGKQVENPKLQYKVEMT